MDNIRLPQKPDVNSGAPEELAVLAPLVAPVYVELKI
jgi:hypothetical protein